MQSFSKEAQVIQLLTRMEKQALSQLGGDDDDDTTGGGYGIITPPPHRHRPHHQEPECEVHSHSSNSNKEVSPELQGHLDEIRSLRDLFMKQSQTLAMIKEKESTGMLSTEESLHDGQSSDLTSTVVDSEYSLYSAEGMMEDLSHHHGHHNALPKTSFLDANGESPTTVTQVDYPEFLGTDVNVALNFDDAMSEVDSYHFDFEGTDSDIADAILEIRKEASQMDTILALDQLKTLESETKVVRSALNERTIEAETLRTELEDTQERVACLELERDLHKADAAKTREDLNLCIDRMFDISCVAGDGAAAGFSDTKKSPLDFKQNPAIDGTKATFQVSTRDFIEAFPDESQDPDSISRPCVMPSQVRSIIRRQSSFSDPGFSRSKGIHDDYRDDEDDDMTPLFQTESRKQKPRSRHSFQGIQDVRTSKTKSSARKSRGRSKSFSTESSLLLPEAYHTADTESHSKMCGLFRRRGSRQGRSDDLSTMRRQLDSLHSMMRSSLSTSSKLRNRVAMISRYYEGIIRKLQEDRVEIKTEKARMKTELDARICALDVETRLKIMQLESVIKRKDRDFVTLQTKWSNDELESGTI